MSPRRAERSSGDDGLAHALPDRPRVARLRARLLEWYREHKRDLPWRRTADPYAIWVSEAMLQQTRVETALDYWERFMRAFPTARALAEADEEEVLAAWSGLGYYRRARSLHAAARAVVERHEGRFPSSREAALELPGVGRYTAGAVLSIAYDAPVALVDGNVERVFSRLFGLDAPSGSKSLVDRCWALAEHLVPRTGGAGDWNQALMELGARVCTPARPACPLCPLSRSCRARRDGTAASLPRPKARPRTVAVLAEVAWIERAGSWLLEQLPEGGRMAGLWQLPTCERPDGSSPLQGLFPPAWPAGIRIPAGEPLAGFRHTITCHRIQARIVRGHWQGERRLPARLGWVPASELAARPLTGMGRKAVAKLERLA